MTKDIPATWDASVSPEQWAIANRPADTLLWKDGLPRQVKDLVAIAHLLDAHVRVAGYHTSKSVRLPVGLLRLDVIGEETIYVFTRNNFYNTKAVVIASCPLEIDYDLVYDEMTAEALAVERQRAYDYQSKGRDFDPQSFETDAWMGKWCSKSILHANERTYRCGTTASCYYEGMEESGVPEDAFERYEHGRSMFAVEVDGAIGLMRLVEAVRDSVLRSISDRLDKAQTLAAWREFSAMPQRRPYHDTLLAEAATKLSAWGMLPENTP